MKRSAWFFSLLVLAVSCNKPSDEACRKALQNIRELIGTDSGISNTDFEGDVRRCKGGSTKKAVECAGNAQTLDDLRKCDFMKVPIRDPQPDTDTGTSAGTGTGTGTADGAGTAAGTTEGTSTGTGEGTGAGTADGTGAGTAAAGSGA